MVVVEAAALWQYYLRSPQITALARRRQEGSGLRMRGWACAQASTTGIVASGLKLQLLRR